MILPKGAVIVKPKYFAENKGKEEFAHNHFRYDHKNDCYICAYHKKLKYMRTHKHRNGGEYRIYANYAACDNCPKKTECKMQTALKHE